MDLNQCCEIHLLIFNADFCQVLKSSHIEQIHSTPLKQGLTKVEMTQFASTIHEMEEHMMALSAG